MTSFREEDQIAEVMRRTIFNLQFIEDRCQDDGPYEVTQLVNSFLGAAVFPWEQLLKHHRDLVNDLAQEGEWPRFRKDLPSDNEPVDSFQQLQWIRHALAHGRVRFEGEGGEITGIRLRNEGYTGIRWGVRLSINELKSVLGFYGELAERLEQDRRNRPPRPPRPQNMRLRNQDRRSLHRQHQTHQNEQTTFGQSIGVAPASE